MIKSSLYIFLVWLLLLLYHQTTTAEPFFLYQDCTSTITFTPNSTYERNLNTLLSRLAATAGTSTNGYGNDTEGESSSSPVYGVFFCRGDLSNDSCSSCVSYAITNRLNRSGCSTNKKVLLGYEECMLHYSDQSFFSKLQLEPSFPIYDTQLPNVTNAKHFADVLSDTTRRVIPRAAQGGRDRKFAVAKASLISSFSTLYMLAQCTPDLSSADCKKCLTTGNASLPQGKHEGRVITPSCSIRFDVFPFYNQSASSWADASANVTSVSAPPPDLASSPGTSPTGNSKKSSSTFVTIATPIVAFLLLFRFWF